MIGDSDGNRYIHSPRGVHAVNDGSDWTYPLTDGLRSVRGYTDAHSNVLSNVNYTPIGVPGTNITGPAFTGEWRTGGTGMQYHRARYYNPTLGVFPSLDPFEGITDRPMSLNGYSWVEGNVVNDAVGELLGFHNRYSYAGGNPVNRVDPDGLCPRPDSGIKARECEFLRQDLRSWGVNVVYDIRYNIIDSGTCLPEQVVEAATQADVQQRWTLSEMSAVHSAFVIFRAARSNSTTFTLTNVRDIEVQGETLEQWIIANVMLRNP